MGSVAPVRLSSVLRPLEDKKSMSESSMEFELCVMCAAFYKNSYETFAMKRPLVRTADAGTPTRTSSSLQPPPLPSNGNYLVISMLNALDKKKISSYKKCKISAYHDGPSQQQWRAQWRGAEFFC